MDLVQVDDSTRSNCKDGSKHESDDTGNHQKSDSSSTVSSYGLPGVFSIYSKLIPIAPFTSQNGGTEAWKQKYDNLVFSHAQEIQGMQKDMAEMAKNVHGEITALQERSANMEQLLTKSNGIIERQTQHIASLQQQLNSSMAVCSQQEKTIASLQEEADKYRQLANTEHELARVQSNIALAESKELQDLRQDLTRSDALVRELRGDIQKLTQDLNQAIQSQNRREAEWMSKVSATETEADRLRKSLDEGQLRHNAALTRFQTELDRVQQERSDLFSRLDKVRGQLTTAEAQLNESREFASGLQRRLQQAEDALSTTQATCKDLRSQLESTLTVLSKTQSECDQMRKISEAQRMALAQVQQQLHEEAQEIEKLRAEKNRIVQEKAAVVDEKTRLQEKLEAEIEKCKHLSKDAEDVVALRELRDRQEAKLRRRQSEYFELETRLANAMRIIDRDQDVMNTAKSSIERLGSTQSIQQEQIELATRELKAKTEEVEQLKSVINSQNEKIQTMIAWKADSEQANVKLRQKIEEDGEKISHIEAERDRQQAVIEEQLERLRQLEKTLKQELNENEKHKNQMKTDQQQIRSLTTSIQQLESDLKAITDGHNEKMQALNATKIELERNISELRQRLDEDDRQFFRIETERQSQLERLRQLQETLQQERGEKTQLQQQIRILTDSNQQLDRELKAADKELERLQHEYQQTARAARDQITALNTELSQSQLEVSEQKRNIGELRDTLSETNQALDKLRKDYNQAVEEHKQRCLLEADRYRMIEGEHDELQQAADKLRHLLGQVEGERDDIQLKADKLRQRLDQTESERNQLQAAERNAVAQMSELNAANLQCHNRLANQQATIKDLKATLQARDSALTELQGQFQRLEQQLGVALTQLSDLNAVLNTLRKDARTRRRYTKTLLKKLGQRKINIRVLQEQLHRQQIETGSLRDIQASLTANVEHTKAELQLLQETHRQQSEQVVDLNAAIVAGAETEKCLHDEVTRWTADFKQSQDELGTLKVLCDETQREVERWKGDAERLREQVVAMKLVQEKAIGSLRKVSNGADACQDVETIPIDASPEDQIVRLSLQLHQADNDKKELNDRIVELNQELKELRRRVGSKSAMFESVLKSQLEKAIKFAAPEAQPVTRSTMSRQSSTRTVTAWEAAQAPEATLSHGSNTNTRMSSAAERHRRYQSMGGTSDSRQPWRI